MNTAQITNLTMGLSCLKGMEMKFDLVGIETYDLVDWHCHKSRSVLGHRCPTMS